jgi:DNA-binding NarL/FixJ family response regulator
MLETTIPRRDVHAPIPTAVVADRDTIRDALLALIADDGELCVAGSASSLEDGTRLLDLPHVRVILVNLSLSEHLELSPGVDFIRRAKARRPDIGILSLAKPARPSH